MWKQVGCKTVPAISASRCWHLVWSSPLECGRDPRLPLNRIQQSWWDVTSVITLCQNIMDVSLEDYCLLSLHALMKEMTTLGRFTWWGPPVSYRGPKSGCMELNPTNNHVNLESRSSGKFSDETPAPATTQIAALWEILKQESQLCHDLIQLWDNTCVLF